MVWVKKKKNGFFVNPGNYLYFQVDLPSLADARFCVHDIPVTVVPRRSWKAGTPLVLHIQPHGQFRRRKAFTPSVKSLLLWTLCAHRLVLGKYYDTIVKEIFGNIPYKSFTFRFYPSSIF